MRSNRWILLLWMTCLSFAGCAESGPGERPGVPPQHLLLITFDGLRSDHCSALGSFRPTTFGAPQDPNFTKKPGLDFDAVAERGVLFPNTFTPSLSATEALASLHSGVHPGREVAAAPNLAESLRAAGFHTIACVSGGALEDTVRLDRGFEVFEAFERDHETIAQAWFHARAAIENQDVERIFVWIHLAEMQAPYTPAKLPRVLTERDLTTLFQDPSYQGNATGEQEFLDRATRGEVALAAADRERIIAAHDAEIARGATLMRAFLERWVYTVQDSLGNYIDAPHEDARWPHTLVVACGTRGTELGEHTDLAGEGQVWGQPRTLHDASLRVPLFFSHTQSLTGKRIFADVVDLCDVAPTLREWFKLELPSGMSGRTLLPRMDTYIERPFEERPAIIRASNGARSLRTERWRLIENAAADRVQLFDLRHDPREERDLASEEPEVLARLLELLDSR